MLWTTQSAPCSRDRYWAGSKMSARSHETLWAQSGGFGDEVTALQWGSPDRLLRCQQARDAPVRTAGQGREAHLTEVTCQPLATAALQILEPRKPFPPHTMIRLDVDMVCVLATAT